MTNQMSGTILKLELIRLLRNRINFIITIALIAFTIYGLWTESVTAVYGFRALHQLAIFFAVFSGYRFSNQQEKKGMREWLGILPNENKRVSAQMLSLYLLFVVVVVGMIICVSVSQMLYPVQKFVFVETIIVLILHYLLPMMVAGTIGWVLGRKFNNIIGYLLVGIIGYILGSFGMQTYLPYIAKYSILKSIAPIFGFDTTGVLYSALSGADLSLTVWLRPVIWLMISWVFVMLVQKRTKRTRRILKITMVITCFTILLGIAFAPSEEILLQKTSQIAKQDDQAYLMETQSVSFSKKSTHWKTLNLNVERKGINVYVEGNGTLIFDEEIDTLKFNLQRQFMVQSITIDSEMIDFAQAGDIITIERNGNKGEALEVAFTYEGRPHGRFLTDDGAILLIGNYQWYPIPMSGQSMLFTDGNVASLPQANNPPVQFSLTVKNDEPYWTNLETTNVATNLSLIFGRVNTKVMNDIEYVYTDLDPVEIDRATKPVVEGVAELRRELDLEEQPITRIVSIIELKFSSIGDYIVDSQQLGDTLYRRYGNFLYPPIEEQEGTRDQEFFRLEVMSAILASEPAFLYQDSEMQKAFLNGYVTIYAPYAAKYVPYPELVTFLEQVENPMEFIKAWHDELLVKQNYTYEDLQNLMETYQ